MYSDKEFARLTAEAVQLPNDQRRAHLLLQRALKSPRLLEGYEEQLKGFEFHVLRTAGCAIKVFCMKTMPGPGWAHDHGGLWGLYGIYRGKMGMAFYAEGEAGKLIEIDRFFMEEGETAWVHSSDIHAVWSPVDGTVALTIYNGDLNGIERRIWDVRKNIMIRDRSQWEARQKLGGGLRKIDEPDPEADAADKR